MNTYKVEFTGHVYNYGKLVSTFEEEVTVEAKTGTIEDIQPAVEETYGISFGSFHLHKVTPLNIREKENDLVRFAAFHGLTYAETVTLPAIIERISQKTGVKEETLTRNIATFNNELSRYVANTAKKVASEVDVLATDAPA